jgi:HSP20 family protein
MNHILKTNGNGRAIFNSFPALFDDLFTKEVEHYHGLPRNGEGRLNNTLPAVNIKETANSFIIELAVPGMEKENFNIELKNKTLTISAKKEDKKEDASTSSATETKDEAKFICRQFGYQNFSRSFTLPEETTDSENLSANYNNGILNVVVPKKEKADSVKQIRIA